jgi:hypothetical protein
MRARELNGSWAQLQNILRTCWPLLTAEDVAGMDGERDGLMRALKQRYEKTYGQIEREVTEFELRDARLAYAARISRGIRNDD